MRAKPENIYLVGLMGAGKTTVGKALARRLGWQFIDSDHEIEVRTGVSIPTIFEIEGEAGFRARETQVLRELTSLRNVVLATGGGIVLAAENREQLRNNGLVAFLDVPPAQLYERTRHDRKRPLLQVADPLQRLRDLYVERLPLYREVADVVIDGSRCSTQSVTQLLVREYEDSCNP